MTAGKKIKNIKKFFFPPYRGVRDDIDTEDVEEAYYRYMEENPMAGVIVEDDEIVEYDADGNAIIPEKKVRSLVELVVLRLIEIVETGTRDKVSKMFRSEPVL